ncbi:beta-galactosidase [Coraliomargarita algicola]|uniref:Beta-galactosidase n=1 Tax=Coraliomargarita algicola TaxID=3092156 RepID=A0ABZ0RNI5_9BACT|nr:beta-galactosidase [Coraliomargarita sp. J2-16]WPJ96696.1 beta-galactosidase [Coraliomargarita sp. J2-16]
MRKLLIHIISLTTFITLNAEVKELNNLTSVEYWTSHEGQSAQATITQWPDRVAVTFEGEKDESFRILLTKPLDLPEWATDWTFIMGNDGGVGRINVWALITDATGQEFRYRLIDPTPEMSAGYPVFKQGFRKVPIRLHTFGLKRPQIGNSESATIRASNGHKLPVAPLQLKGLELVAGSQESKGTLSFGEFKLSGVIAKESSLYYALEGTEHFGEVDPIPYITLADFGHFFGEIYDVEWEMRDQYDGQAILSGHKTFRLTEDDPTSPYAVQLEQRIEFPVKKKGTYWIRSKLRWAKSAKKFPDEIIEKDFRLDVIHSQYDSNPSFEVAMNRPIRLAPERSNFTYEANEALQLPVVFHPANDSMSQADSYRVTIQAFAGTGPITVFSGPLNTSDATTVLADLAEKTEGAWTLKADLLQDGRVVDSKTQLFGLKAGNQHLVKVPQTDALSQSTDPSDGESLIMLYAQLPDNMREKATDRWEAIEPYLNRVPEVTDLLEVPIRWRHLEPLPGIINWTWIDTLMDAAAKRRIKIVLAPSFVSNEPDWIPPAFKQNEEGAVFGHRRYLYKGMRSNLWNADVLRANVMRVVSAMAKRYANHPAMGGYLVLTEHPGDHPYTNWIEGYAPETLQDYHRYLQANWSDLDTINQRWNTHYDSWKAIGVPTKEASPRQHLDWLTFRYDSISDLLMNQVRAIRQADPKHLLEVYGDGLTPKQYQELKKHRVIRANGGAHTPELSGLTKAALAVYDMQERAEEHSVGHWTAYGPYQLDATVFNMLLGGGQNAHMKMFTRTNVPFEELQGPKFSMGRFKQFIPILKELRQVGKPPIEAYVLNNIKARLEKAQSTTFISFATSSVTRSMLESHLIAPLVELSTATQGKLIFALSDFGDSYEAPVIDTLVQYVENGGTLVMTADAGRRSADLPDEEWILLQRFGWEAPKKNGRYGRKERVTTLENDIFKTAGQSFELSGQRWLTHATDADIARYQDGSPALSQKTFGQGRVIVLWSNGLVPPADTKNGVNFIGQIADSIGVPRPSSASHPRIFTNLLKHNTGPSYYGLAYHSGSHMPWGQEGPALDAQTKWTVPTGNYQISELISDRDLGIFSASELEHHGIPCELVRHAVAIYRMTPQP